MAASGDLRCTMKTILSVPSGHKKRCAIVIIDGDPLVALRNTILLLLALMFPNGEASELIFHLWYSASLPAHIIRFISEKLTPRIRELVEGSVSVKEGVDAHGAARYVISPP